MFGGTLERFLVEGGERRQYRRPVEIAPHLFVKRDPADETLRGDPRWQCARIADPHGL